MKINETQKNNIVTYFSSYNFKIVAIARMYEISSARVRQILLEKLGEEKYKKIRQKQIKNNSMLERYKNDPNFRQLCIDRASKRYYENKNKTN